VQSLILCRGVDIDLYQPRFAAQKIGHQWPALAIHIAATKRLFDELEVPRLALASTHRAAGADPHAG
jgi:hypothetical protein